MILIFLATFIRVFLLAMQTLNVVHGFYFLAVLTTAGIAWAETSLYINVPKVGWKAFPVMFLGGAMGVTSAMYLHRLLVQ